jgi:outer membrane protein OmpA-like peptidoglycan-associated protein
MQVQREAEESARRAQQQAEQARLEAQREIERANQAKLDAERARADAQSEAERSRMLAHQAEEQRLRAEQERAETRQRLMHQLNLVLETRDSARGLIVNMSDVLFDTGKADLKPGARERLAKVAGILLAHPGLNLEIEGHTDSVGGEEFNQRLSERRAASVRDYLVQMGVDMNAITARGFGKNQPVASNTTATGRQLNRRVELVVSGEAIGRRQQPQQQREQILSSQ